MANRKKQEDRHLSILKDLVQQPPNKKCFDCGQRGPTYVNMTIGAFVCTSCSGLLRGLNPPHRVKSISMASFSTQEIEFLEKHGNEVCRGTWLAMWTSPLAPEPESREEQKVKDFLIRKYERKVWYSSQPKAKPQDDTIPEPKPLKELLGENSAAVQVKSEKPPPAKNAIQVLPPFSAGQPSPTKSHPPPSGQKNVSAMDLLGDFSVDPFGSSQQSASSFPVVTSAPTAQPTAAFDAFGPLSPGGRIQPQAPGQARSDSVAFDFFSSGTGVPSSVDAAPFKNVNEPGRDKYAAFADLSALAPPSTHSVFGASSNLATGPLNQPNPFMTSATSTSAAHAHVYQQQQQQKPTNPFQNAPSAAPAFGQTSNYGAQSITTSSWNMVGPASGMRSTVGGFVGMSNTPASYAGVGMVRPQINTLAQQQQQQQQQQQAMSFGGSGVSAGAAGQFYMGSAQPIGSSVLVQNVPSQLPNINAGFPQAQHQHGLQMFAHSQQMVPQQQLVGYSTMPTGQGFGTQPGAQFVSPAGLYNSVQPAQQFQQAQSSFTGWGQTAGGFPAAQQGNQIVMSKSTNPFM